MTHPNRDIFAVGLSHHTTPIDLRERVAVSDSELADTLHTVAEEINCDEVTIVSTCNRVEVYLAGSPADDWSLRVIRILARRKGIDPEMLVPHRYMKAGREAIHHLFRVAASLDSLVLGEPQILGQVKTAFFEARKHRRIGPVLSKLFDRAIQVAKWVRNETSIGVGAISVPYAAFELSKRVFGDLSRCRVLLVGAGKMGKLSARNLADAGISELIVCNRSHERAKRLAEGFSGRDIPLAQLEEALVDSDIVISAAAADGYLVTQEMFHRVSKQRRGKRIFLIDISVPRSIDPECNRIQDVYLYNVDDLKAIVEENRKSRSEAALAAEKLILEAVNKFSSLVRHLELSPLVAALRGRLDAIRTTELSRLFAAESTLLPQQRAAIEQMTKALMNKVLHPTLAELKRAPEQQALHESARRLFGLDRSLRGVDQGKPADVSDDPETLKRPTPQTDVG